MIDWQPIETAPKDGTWIKVRGRDFGAGPVHYAIAFYERARWREVGSNGGQLSYLNGWSSLHKEATQNED